MRKEGREKGDREREKEKSREGGGKGRRLAVLDLWIIDYHNKQILYILERVQSYPDWTLFSCRI